MGYESKIYVVQEYEPTIKGKLPYGEVLATFDLCKMNYEVYNGCTFRGLFVEPRSCDFYADDMNTVIKEDCYGDKVEKADMEAVLNWLNKFCANEDWWRARVFRDYLLLLKHEGISPSIYHYGY